MQSLGNAISEFSFRTRQETWETLKNNPDHIHNVFIIGGGIVGAGFLRELAIHKVNDVILVEKNDFASGTSGASSKLVHAGIRYLEQAWMRLKRLRLIQAWQSFNFVLEASRERKVLGRLAPHLVKPKAIYTVLGVSDGRSPLSVLMGVWLYYLMQFFQGQFFSPPRIILRESAIKAFAPELNAKEVKAIFSFWDSETDDARLVIENLQFANRHGAKALNYVQLIGIKKEDGFWLLDLKSKVNGEVVQVKTKIVINAAGPFADDVYSMVKPQEKTKLVDRVAGAHLDVYPALTSESYYITAGDGRLIFILKRQEDGLIYTRLGTTERPLAENETSDDPKATQDEIEYLRKTAESFLNEVKISDDQMLRIDSGIRPLTAQATNDAFQKSREHKIIEDNGLFHVLGVKLTDFRRVAAELIEKIPWKEFRIDISYAGSSSHEPLREKPNSVMYEEKDSESIINQTMVIYWEDYVKRRRGLAPRVMAKSDHKNLKKKFDEMSKMVGWSKDEYSEFL